MPEAPTPSTGNGDESNAQDNWEQRYQGLQKVLAKRDADLTTRDAELGSLRTEHEQALARLAEHEQARADATEEEQARQTYEALKERFESEPPTPIGNNPQRTWADGSDKPWAGRERAGSAGFPI